MTPLDLAIAFVIFCIMLVNIALIYAILRQRQLERPTPEKPHKLEIIVRSAYLGEIMQEERMLVDATVDEPVDESVELTFVLDEQAKDYL